MIFNNQFLRIFSTVSGHPCKSKFKGERASGMSELQQKRYWKNRSEPVLLLELFY